MGMGDGLRRWVARRELHPLLARALAWVTEREANQAARSWLAGLGMVLLHGAINGAVSFLGTDFSLDVRGGEAAATALIVGSLTAAMAYMQVPKDEPSLARKLALGFGYGAMNAVAGAVGQGFHFDQMTLKVMLVTGLWGGLAGVERYLAASPYVRPEIPEKTGGVV